MSEGEKPFSVRAFNATWVEHGTIVEWKEELEDGTREVRIVVRTEEEFSNAIDRFARAVRSTWPLP